MSTQTDQQSPVESQFYIIEEFTNDEETKPSVADDESKESMEFDIKDVNEKEEITIIEEEELSIKDEGKTRRKFDRFDCYICKLQLPGNFQFVQHFNQKHPDKDLKYQCYICSGFVKKYRSFTRHIESHIEKRFA